LIFKFVFIKSFIYRAHFDDHIFQTFE